MQFKVVGTVPAQGARAVLCRMAYDQDAVEFAVVDIHSWVVDEFGTMVPYVFDSELGEPVSLEWMTCSYGGVSAASGILETKATILSGADMDRFEKVVRRRQAKLEARIESDGAELYRAKIKAAVENAQLMA